MEYQICLQPQDSQTNVFTLRLKELNQVNVTVRAKIEAFANCSSATDAEGLMDTIQKPIQVKAEGFPVESVKSEFLCNNNNESPPQKSSPKEKQIICDLKDATMNDVVLTDKKDNVVAGNQKLQVTRLKMIRGYCVTNIDMQQLQMFSNKVGIKGMRNKSKFDVCNAIVNSIVTGRWKKMKEATDKEEKKKEAAKKKVAINRRRL